MKEKVSIPLEEQETVINFYPAETGKDCEIYTTIPSMMRYLERMIGKYPDQCRLVKDDQYSYTAQIPFKLVKPRNPRIYTDEQKQAIAERLASIRR